MADNPSQSPLLDAQEAGFSEHAQLPGTTYWSAVFCLLILIVIGGYVHTKLWDSRSWGIRIESQDIYYIFLEGDRITAGVNPYSRIFSGDMLTNKKYPTYFPLFYLLASCSQLAGFHTFSEWLAFWRVVFLIFNVAIACLIFQICMRRNMHLLALFGVLFWLFNRWTLHVTLICHLDFIPIFFLLLSLALLPSRFYWACLFFGLSLAIKQIAVFVMPLYLILAWKSNQGNRISELVKACLLICAVPAIASIPFLIWDAEGLLMSVIFSATRYPSDHFGVASIDALFGFHGVIGKIPLVLLLIVFYAVIFLQRVPPYTSALIIMLIFVNFNSVLFRQYMVWFLPFVPLVLVDAPFLGQRPSVVENLN